MSELQDQINKLISYAKYIEILQQHGFFDDAEACLSETLRPFDTLPIIFDRIRFLNENDLMDRKEVNEELYDITKFLANLMIFCDAMKPIADKYNPTAEQRHQFLLYLNKEENNDNGEDEIH